MSYLNFDNVTPFFDEHVFTDASVSHVNNDRVHVLQMAKKYWFFTCLYIELSGFRLRDVEPEGGFDLHRRANQGLPNLALPDPSRHSQGL